MRVVHEILAWVVMIGSGAVGTAIAAGHWVEPLRHRMVWWSAHGMFVVIGVQATLGALLFSSVDGEVNETHMFYGFLTLAGVGLMLAYRHLSAYRQLLYGLGLMFVMGLAIRAFTLDPVL